MSTEFQLHWHLPTQRFPRLAGHSSARGYSAIPPNSPELLLLGRNQLCTRRDPRAETEISHKDKTSALSPTSCYSWCSSRVWGRRSAGAVRTPVGQATLTPKPHPGIRQKALPKAPLWRLREQRFRFSGVLVPWERAGSPGKSGEKCWQLTQSAPAASERGLGAGAVSEGHHQRLGSHRWGN